MSKYSEIESGYSLSQFQSVPRPPVVAPRPLNVRCIPRLISSADNTKSYSLDVQWQPPLNLLGQRDVWVTSYYVEFKRGASGVWGSRQETSQPYARYENVGGGAFFARVAAVISVNGKVSQWAESGAGTLTTVQAVADASSANYSYFATEF